MLTTQNPSPSQDGSSAHEAFLDPTVPAPGDPPDAAASRAEGARGMVKWFNEKKGFGFIVDPNVPTDIFVHFSAIRADGFRTLNEGDQVAYELYRDEKGAKARNVVRVE